MSFKDSVSIHGPLGHVYRFTTRYEGYRLFGPDQIAFIHDRAYAKPALYRIADYSAHDPHNYSLYRVWQMAFQKPWTRPRDINELVCDLSEKIHKRALFVYLEETGLERARALRGESAQSHLSPEAPPGNEIPPDTPRTRGPTASKNSFLRNTVESSEKLIGGAREFAHSTLVSAHSYITGLSPEEIGDPAGISPTEGHQAEGAQIYRDHQLAFDLASMFLPGQQSRAARNLNNELADTLDDAASTHLSQPGGLASTEGARLTKPNGKLTKPTHPLAKHGPDVTDEQLINRVQEELIDRGRSGTITRFDDRALMEETIHETFYVNRGNIKEWMDSNPRAGVPKAFEHNPGRGNLGTGYTVSSSGDSVEKVDGALENVKVVLMPNGNGNFLIHTAYPY